MRVKPGRFNHSPRCAYCTGCGVTFPKMHVMINHRRLHRCGGRFLPDDEIEVVQAVHAAHVKYNNTNSIEDMVRYNNLRVHLNRMRHDRVQNAQAAARR